MRLQVLSFLILSSLTNVYADSINCEHIKPEISFTPEVQTSIQISEFVQQKQINDDSETIVFQTDLTKLLESDNRKEKNSSSPDYLDAVGKIVMVMNGGYKAQCSGSLISTKHSESSRVIASAAHCFGNTKTKQKYNLTSINWVVKLKSGETITETLTLKDYNYDEDIAILTLDSKIPFSKIKPLLIETEIQETAKNLVSYGDKVIVAGYSSNPGKGNLGEKLTYDDSISYKKLSRYNDSNNSYNPILRTVTYGGASGGALIVDIDLSEDEVENPFKQKYLAGVLIGGIGAEEQYINQGYKGSTQSNYSTYYNIINMKVEKYNK